MGSAGNSIRYFLPPTLALPLKRLKRKLSVMPVRLLFPESSTSNRAVRVVIYGSSFNWLSRLGDFALWKDIPGVAEVLLLPDDSGKQIPRPFHTSCRTVIIPLSEDNINNCPRNHPALIPNRRAVEILRNKATFAAYINEYGLADLCPVTYESGEHAEFPCILKRVNASYGRDSMVLRSKQELARAVALSQEEFILQSLVRGTTEYTTHCICKDGRIIWSYSVGFEMDGPEEIRRGMVCKEHLGRVTPPAGTFAAIERVLAPLGYSGPCNVNYKRSGAGTISIFEVNPRFGGSLMQLENVESLREALSCVIDNATSC